MCFCVVLTLKLIVAYESLVGCISELTRGHYGIPSPSHTLKNTIRTFAFRPMFLTLLLTLVWVTPARLSPVRTEGERSHWVLLYGEPCCQYLAMPASALAELNPSPRNSLWNFAFASFVVLLSAVLIVGELIHWEDVDAESLGSW